MPNLESLRSLGELGFATLAVLTVLVVILLVAAFGYMLLRGGIKAVHGLTESIDRNTTATQALTATTTTQHVEVIAGLSRLENRFLSELLSNADGSEHRGDDPNRTAEHRPFGTETPQGTPGDRRQQPQHRETTWGLGHA